MAAGKNPKGKAPLVVVVPPRKNPPRPKQPTTASPRIRGRDRIWSIQGTTDTYTIPLVPGWTGGNNLDIKARLHGWCKWSRSPTLEFKSLSSSDSAPVLAVRVIHNVPLADALAGRVQWCDVTDCETYKGTQNFSHNVGKINGLAEILNPHTVKQLISVLQVVVMQPSPITGELFLRYDVQAGGKPAAAVRAQAFQVTDKVSSLEQSHDMQAIPDGIKFSTPGLRELTFTGTDNLGITRPQLKDVVSSSSGVDLIEIKRGPQPNNVLGTIKDVVTSVLIHVAEGAVLKLLSKLPGRSETGPSFTGSVLVTGPGSFVYPPGSIASAPPMYVMDKEEPATRGFGPVVRFLRVLGPVVRDLALSALPSLALSYLSSFAHKGVAHRGEHAHQYLNSITLGAAGEGTGGSSQGDVPDRPDFQEDPTAPGVVVDWVGSLQYGANYTVYKKRNVGTANYVGYTRGVVSTSFGTGNPIYFHPPRFNAGFGAIKFAKMPWDAENKEYATATIQVGDELAGYFLLLETYTWGDNSVGMWCNWLKGGKYIGTVANYCGISCARSVVQITDPKLFSSAENIMFGIALGAFEETDEGISGGHGRSGMNTYKLGAVSDFSVAKTFLANWTTGKGYSEIENTTYYEGSQNQYWGPLAGQCLTDFNTSVISKTMLPRGQGEIPDGSINGLPVTNIGEVKSDPNLDPSAPGFAERYQELTAPPGTRAQPAVKLEAGPVRFTTAVAVNETSGWYRDPSDKWQVGMSTTSHSARWNYESRLRGADDGTIPYNWNSEARTYIIRPPDLYCRAGNFLCVEFVGVSMRNYINLKVHGNNWRVSTRTSGPLTFTRVYGEMNTTKAAQLWYSMDKAKPCNFLPDDGYGDESYQYIAGMATCWIVGSEQVASKWACFDAATNTTASLNQNLQMYEVEDGQFGQEVSDASGFLDFSKSREKEFWADSFNNVVVWVPGAGFINFGSGFPGQRASRSKLQIAGPPAGGPNTPSVPPSGQHQGYQQDPQILPPPTLKVPPLVSTPSSSLVRTSVSIVTRNNGYYYNDKFSDGTHDLLGVSVTSNVNFGDERGLVVYNTGNTSAGWNATGGGPDVSKHEVGTRVPRVTVGVPRLDTTKVYTQPPKLTVIEMFRVGKITWDYTNTPKRIAAEGAYTPMAFWPGASFELLTTLNPGLFCQPFGVSAMPRLLKARLFTSAFLSQEPTVTQSLYSTGAARNIFLVARQIDLPKISDTYDETLTFPTWLNFTGPVREHLEIWTSFGDFDKTLDEAIKHCGSMLEFVGEYRPCNDLVINKYSDMRVATKTDGVPQVFTGYEKLPGLVESPEENTPGTNAPDNTTPPGPPGAPSEGKNPAGQDVPPPAPGRPEDKPPSADYQGKPMGPDLSHSGGGKTQDPTITAPN